MSADLQFRYRNRSVWNACMPSSFANIIRMRSSGRGRLLVGADESHLVDYIKFFNAIDGMIGNAGGR